MALESIKDFPFGLPHILFIAYLASYAIYMRLELLQVTFFLVMKVSPDTVHVVVPLVFRRGQYLHFLFLLLQAFLFTMGNCKLPIDLLCLKLVSWFEWMSLVEELACISCWVLSLLRSKSITVCGLTGVLLVCGCLIWQSTLTSN